jgi:hypothetical protein
MNEREACVVGTKEIVSLFLLGVFLGYMPLLFNARFYFLDDMQHQYMPVFYNIGRCLRLGEFPFFSLTNWLGGNFLGEQQFGLLNPVSLLSYFILPSIPSLAAGAAVLACFYYGALCSGFYFLSRTYEIERPAALIAAITITTSNFIAYFFASSWIAYLIGLSWLVWAWGYIRLIEFSSKSFLLAVVFSYLTITTGCPQVSLLLGFVIALTVLEKGSEKNYRGSGLAVAALVSAILLSMPSLIPSLSRMSNMSRPTGVFNNEFLVPNLHNMLAMSFPLFHGRIFWAKIYRFLTLPAFYCAWYIVPLLPFLQWKEMNKNRSAIFLATGVALILLATQGPEQFGPARWPFRFIPFFHMFVVLFFFKLLKPNLQRTPSRKTYALSILLLALVLVMAWQKMPVGFEWSVALECCTALLLALAVLRKTVAGFYAVLIVVSLLFFVATRAQFIDNTQFYANWGMPSEVGEHALTDEVPRAYTMYLGDVGDTADKDRLKEFQTGNMPIEYGAPTIGGYSPIGHSTLQRTLCMSGFGETCPDAVVNLFPVQGTGTSDGATDIGNSKKVLISIRNSLGDRDKALADLMRINRLIVMKGAWLDNATPYLKDWRVEYDGRVTQRFVRDLPNDDLPGTVSWVSPGVKLEALGTPHATREKLSIGPHDNNAHIIFSRLWWPGYRAQYNGTDIPVRAEMGIFASVYLPADSTGGTLLLSYLPPHLILSLVLALLGCVLMVLCLWSHRISIRQRWA